MRSFLVRGAVAISLAAAPVVGYAAKESPFANQSKPMKARVTILAVSSTSRQSFAGNQDVYLADLEVKGTHTFVRLIDQYPGFGLPIRESLLRDRAMFKLQVTREPECDMMGSQIFLRPNNSQIYNGSVQSSLASNASESVPCYKALHQTITIAKRK